MQSKHAFRILLLCIAALASPTSQTAQLTAYQANKPWSGDLFAF